MARTPQREMLRCHFLAIQVASGFHRQWALPIFLPSIVRKLWRVLWSKQNAELCEFQKTPKLRVFAFLKKPVEIETLVDHIRQAYKKKLEKSMSAIAFAEEGEFNTAREMMKEEEDKND